MNHGTRTRPALGVALAAACLMLAGVVGVTGATEPWQNGQFQWQASAPWLDVAAYAHAPNPQVAVKDPSVVRHNGRWHVFATLRHATGKVDMVYLNFGDWAEANRAPRHILNLHDQYHCAPQVFYFTPHQRWYLIAQMADRSGKPAFGPCFSTNERVDQPAGWSRPRMMVTNSPPNPRWLDFWVIGDGTHMHLFYTTLDGRMWRRQARREDFPYGWGEEQLALQADIFEASHTYKLKGRQEYLTIVEAQGGGGRYYKAYLARSLAGPWEPLAATWEKPFASRLNVRQNPVWTASISHGELIRAGVDEGMEVEPERLQMVFQGASDEEYRGRPYGQIPWRLGLLTLAP
ncbi:non-reducing end alpha-L-arabinofuranosidase family hydrolase [Fontisphaera persica]|uniref:non-reducing end alpha-L-arabinofuranosidase family hydrolase n=1 Tax=Fontisphaera persica TaxID=2974023 RepID=UPI0024C0B205|nr:non-reducing end alpha-L-arabinofuranosidase family hydrolase [Fontisphaera persica]WCJ59133.1 non-reducing end alpha-L-arabinofuranosidase family hydrolase [Fontisphaera persica]